MALETSAEAPVPVRTVLQLVGGWIGRLGRIWVDGEIAERAGRGGTVFLTLRNPVAPCRSGSSARGPCSTPAEPPPAEGSRVVARRKPDFNAGGDPSR